MVGSKREKPILVGLSGGIDSMVAAYLLRIQKRELYAVLLASTPEQFQDEGDQLFACHQTDARIAQVKKFCEHLQIPLTVVRPRDEFADEVMDSWLAARIELRRPRTCHDCHGFRMHMLMKYMKELDCSGIATGHYAKLMRQAPGAPVSVHSSNDLAHDQAGLVAALPQEILTVLELPLSELQRKEVHKIAENFALKPTERALQFGQCLPSHPKLTELLKKQTPPSLLHEGEVIAESTDNMLARHEGHIDFELGKPWKEPRSGEIPQIVIGARREMNEIVVAVETYFNDKAALLTNCQWGEGTDFSSPLKGFIHHEGGLSDKEVIIQPRTLRGAYIQLLEGEELFGVGSTLTIFRRRGKNAKVLVTGQIQRLGRHWKRNVLEMDAQGENGVQKVEVDKDFNF